MTPILEMVALSIWQSFYSLQFNENSYNCHAEFCTWMGVSVRLWLRRRLVSCLFGPHLREQQYILDAVLTRKQHGDTIDAKTYTRCGRHAIFQGPEKVMIDEHGLVIAPFHQL